MIFKIFNTNQPLILILFFIIELAIWGFNYFTGNNIQISSNQYNSVFADLIADFNTNYHLLSKIFAFILLFFHALYLTWLNQKYFFIKKRTFLPAIIYLLLVSSLSQFQEFYAVIISNTFFLFIINELFGLYKKNIAIKSFYNIGLLFATLSLIYTNYIFYMPILWISFVVLKPVNLQEWLSGFVGFLTPILIFALSYYVFFYNGEFNWIDYLYLFKNAELFTYSLYDLIFIGFLGFLLTLTTLHLLVRYDSTKISTRKYVQVFIYTLLLSIVIYLAVPFVDSRIFIPAAISMSYMLTLFLTNVRSVIFQELAFTLLFIGSLILQIL